ncbi:MAG: hypothetical protein IB618_01480 [Candidatus Pacearchaeota archaeon]|nr:MAG: hypothetical protein IB618_01480 [Candidatus Pacearchaeota archaeon]
MVEEEENEEKAEEREEQEEEEKVEDKEKEKKKETKEKVEEIKEIREIPFRPGPEPVKRTAPILEKTETREFRGEKLEDFLSSVEVKKPEVKKEAPIYAPVHAEEEEPKYRTTAEITRVEAREEVRPRRAFEPAKVRETKPLLREIETGGRFEEVIKYEKTEREEFRASEFEPAFKHPEKKVRKYKKLT